MKWAERLPLATLLLAAVALWLPWVDHGAAALVLAGLDLPEFVRFMGEYRAGALPVQPIAFAAPMVALAVAGAAYAARERPSFWGRVVAVGLCLWLLTVPFPPLEKQRELVLAVAAVVAVHAGLSMVRVSPRLLALLVALMTVVAALLPLWQFLVMLPALNRLYGRPVAFGAGVYLEVLVAVAAVALLGVLGRALMRRPSARLRPPA
ncbi:MAG: hypothetical protein ACYC5O_17445 [Anaerolineae bacterium]